MSWGSSAITCASQLYPRARRCKSRSTITLRGRKATAFRKAVVYKRMRIRRTVIWIVAILAVLLIAGYFIAGAVIHKKVDAALRSLPPSLQVSYAGLHSNLFNGTMDLDGVKFRYTRDKRTYEGT